MAISVQGIGWFSGEGYGCIRSGQQRQFEPGEGGTTLPSKGVFSHPFKNFGRLDAMSKSTVYAVALALQDAGIEYSPLRKQSIGIVGTNREGSLRTDIEYFQDYIRAGRTLSRANLFIYTLPSSPLGEAAIHFGLQGPVLYAGSGGGDLGPLLETACEMINHNEAEFMLFGTATEESAVYFVLGRRHGSGEAVCDSVQAAGALAAGTDVRGIVQRFSQMCLR